jgi:hypothetical protein
MDVRISADGEPPTGVLRAADQASVSFAGWLELLDALARALDTEPSARSAEEPDVSRTRSRDTAG